MLPYDPRMVTLFVAALLACACAARAQDPHSGERPYEMAGRPLAHAPLVDFEDLSGWTVIEHEGASGSIETSRDQQLWGDYVAKITYRGAKPESALEIRPPAPIPIPGEFDAAYIWTYGDNWGWMPAPNRPSLCAIIEDAEGAQHEIGFGTIDAQYWFLAHARVKLLGAHAAHSPDIKYPARFKALVLHSIRRDEPSAIYVDNLTFYREPLAPLQVPPPGRNPFPTTPDTILPTVYDKVANRLERRDGAWVWRCVAQSGTLEYVWRPRQGTLGDIEVRWNGRAFRPCAAGGPAFEVGGVEMRPEDATVSRTLLSARREGDALRATWRWSKGAAAAQWTLLLRVKGRSLILDITAPGGNVTEILVGHSEGTARPKLVSVPYLTYGDRGPYVLYSDGLFLSAMFDWYNSDASELFAAGAVLSDSAARYTGGARYNPKTDGRRNDARERIFLTVSPRFEEVLPNIPNPRSDMIDIARHHLWRQMVFMYPETLKQYAAYGIDGLMACHHEIIWRDGGESFTQRLESAPLNVGDERLREYLALIRSLGFLPGLYTNYRDFAPVNRQWDPDKVTRLPDGNWQRAWPRNYVFKPCFADDAEAYFAPRIHDKFGTGAGYCDVHTAVRPWDQTDYDARVPGAGMFRPAFESYGRLLYNESLAHHGPVFSEGRNHWFYAGLVDGNYGQIISPNPAREPALVDFDLLKIHPLETDFGMGDPGMFYSGEANWHQDPTFHSPYFDRFIACTIAYGHIGFLAAEWGLPGALKSFYLMRALQELYAGVEVEEIRYHSAFLSPPGRGQGEGAKAGDLLTTSQAIATDAYRDSQVYVRYRNGLEVWVNCSWDKDWALQVDGEQYLLLPAGFVCRMAGKLLEYSAVVDGARREYVECADYVYLDTRGALLKVGPAEGRGAVAIKRAPDGLWVIPATECDALTIFPNDGPWDLQWRPQDVTATAYSEAGENLGAAECRPTRGGVAVMPVEGAIKYYLRCAEQAAAEAVAVEALTEPEVHLVAAGETLNAAVRVRGIAAPAPSVTCSLRWVGATGSVEAVGAPENQKPGQGAWAFRVTVPEQAAEGERLWLRAQIEGAANGTPFARVAWLDFIVVPALTLEVRAPPQMLPRGAPALLEIEAAANLLTPEPLPATVAIYWLDNAAQAPSPAIPHEARTQLHRGSPVVVRIPFTAPQTDLACPFRVTLSARGKTISRDLWLRAERGFPTIYDFAAHYADCAWGHRLRGGEEVAGAGDSGAIFAPDKVPAAGEARDGFFVHPPWQTGVGYTYAVFPIDLPREPCRLSFGIGIRDGSTTQDGVEYRIAVIDERGEHEVFRRTRAEIGWEDHVIDLSPWSGQRVCIKLVADVGPNDNSYSDWGGWSRPLIELAQPMVRLSVHEQRPALSYLPPPAGFAAAAEADLQTATAATLHMQTFGVDAGQYACVMYFNDATVGAIPATGADDWREASVILPPEMIARLRAINRLRIANPRGDCFKIRDIWLEVALRDGRRAASWIATGPYCSDSGWLHAEGACVSLGQPLPEIELRFDRARQARRGRRRNALPLAVRSQA